VVTVATWNVNGVRARAADVDEWLRTTRPDLAGIPRAVVLGH